MTAERSSVPAPEARQVTVKTALDLGLQAWRTTKSRERFVEAHDAVDALAADLAAALATAEQLREALVRIAGTPTKNSSAEARQMARYANETLAAVPDPEEPA